MNRNMSSLGAALASLCTATALHAQTRVVYVDQTAPAGGDGTSWQRAFRELDVALTDIGSTQLASGVEVRIAQGIYRPSMGGASDPVFSMSAYSRVFSGFTFSLLGSFGGLRSENPDQQDFVRTPTTLSGDVLNDDLPAFGNRDDNRGPVLYKDSIYRCVVVLNGLCISGGRSTFRGAGGLSLDSPSSAAGNYIADCVFEDNEGSDGGGVSIVWHLGLRGSIERCLIRNNRAVNGAGVYADASFDVRNSVIESNVATQNGGGIFCPTWASDRLHPVACIVAGNHAQSGGGVYGPMWISNSLIVANAASLFGGGCALDWGYVTFSTIVDNRAFGGGGVDLPLSSVYFSANIIARNQAEMWGDQVSIRASYQWFRQCLLSGGRDQVYLAPNARADYEDLASDANVRFVDPAGPDADGSTWRDNNYRLRHGSTAIDASRVLISGDLLDLDGLPRVRPGTPGGASIADLGCYEYQPHCPADINQDDGITVDDLLAFLTAYTFGLPLADIDDGSGTNTPDDGVTVEDLLYFLARYNEGC